MKPTQLIYAAALSGLIAMPAVSGEYSVRRELQVSAPFTEVWHAIGDFCDIDDWHPAITACATKVIDGKIHRILTTADGGEFVEQRIATEAGLSYTYKITASPLPLQKYTATLSVTPNDGTLISWSARFSSDDPTAETVITGILDDGLASIDAAFSGK